MRDGGILHLFNPETDFALGHGGEYYTPKSSIIALRKKLSLLPSLWAKDGDSILLLDSASDCLNPKFQQNIREKNLKILSLDDLKALSSMCFDDIKPWGWNFSIRRKLLDLGVDSKLLPDGSTLHKLRNIAHRRTTIKFHSCIGTQNELIPVELYNIAEVKEWCGLHPNGYLKAPWSSSGRGIYHTRKEWEKSLENWCIGAFSKQKSILAEPDWKQEFDFATEWYINDSTPHFIGYSLFLTDSHNQYTGNIGYSQQEIENLLSSKGWNKSFLDRQKNTLKCIVGKDYNGPVGIDSLYSPNFGFNLCVEINFRMTMGMIPLLK